MNQEQGSPPAGWYPVDEGAQERWWDGQAWSEHVRDPQGPTGQEVALSAQQRYVTRQEKKAARREAAVAAVVEAPQQELPEGAVWHAVGKPMTGIGAGRYRLDARYLYFEEGTLRTNSQQLPVSQIDDVDVKQSMTQKARGVFTVWVHSGAQIVRLEDIEDGYLAQQRINEVAHASRLAQQRTANTMHYEGNASPHQPQVHIVQAPAAPTSAAAPATEGPAASTSSSGGDDLMEKLTQLAKLRSEGVLSEEEFVAAKAKLLA